MELCPAFAGGSAWTVLPSVSTSRRGYRKPWRPPVGHNAREIGFLVLIHLQVALVDEALLVSKGPDDANAQQCFVEVRVDR